MLILEPTKRPDPRRRWQVSWLAGRCPASGLPGCPVAAPMSDSPPTVAGAAAALADASAARHSLSIVAGMVAERRRASQAWARRTLTWARRAHVLHESVSATSGSRGCPYGWQWGRNIPEDHRSLPPQPLEETIAMSEASFLPKAELSIDRRALFTRGARLALSGTTLALLTGIGGSMSLRRASAATMSADI